MCGRYYVDDETAREIERIVQRVQERLVPAAGDVYPSQRAAVLFVQEGKIAAGRMRWGLPGFQGNRLMINARAEGVTQKRMFRDSILHRRCIVPAAGFYEWDQKKNKAAFQREEGNCLYMAGLFKPVEEESCFTILTTRANESVSSVHERMPLLLERGEVEKWLKDQNAFLELLDKIPGPLRMRQEYEQVKLPFLE